MKIFRTSFLVWGILVCVISCSEKPKDSSPQVAKMEPTYAAIQAQIIKVQCLDCHTGVSSSSRIDLSTYESLLTNEIVVPGSPDASKFYSAIHSGSMPKGFARLPDNQIQAVFDWIKNGAEK